jgi:hypothetical protein
MLVIRADQRISPQESAIMERAGKALGLEQEFCRNAMREILDNPWVEVSPPYFSDKTVAESFILDGLMLALADGPLHAVELAWLRKVAAVNGLDDRWFDHERSSRSGVPPHSLRLNVEGAALTNV